MLLLYLTEDFLEGCKGIIELFPGMRGRVTGPQQAAARLDRRCNDGIDVHTFIKQSSCYYESAFIFFGNDGNYRCLCVA